MIRPGYFDDQGNTSEGANFGRRDSYTPTSIAAIAGAIATSKARYHPRRLVLVGHSGGTAIAGVMLGKYPHLADAAVLVSCPCDLDRWRAMTGRRPRRRRKIHSGCRRNLQHGVPLPARDPGRGRTREQRPLVR